MLNLKTVFLAILVLLNSGLAFAQSSTLSALPAITSPADTDQRVSNGVARVFSADQ